MSSVGSHVLTPVTEQDGGRCSVVCFRVGLVTMCGPLLYPDVMLFYSKDKHVKFSNRNFA